MNQKDSETIQSASRDELPTVRLYYLKFPQTVPLIGPQNWGEFSFKPQQTVVMGGSHSISALASSEPWQRWTVLSSLVTFTELGSEQMSRRQGRPSLHSQSCRLSLRGLVPTPTSALIFWGTLLFFFWPLTVPSYTRSMGSPSSQPST